MLPNLDVTKDKQNVFYDTSLLLRILPMVGGAYLLFYFFLIGLSMFKLVLVLFVVV